MRAWKHAVVWAAIVAVAGCLASREVVRLPVEDSLVRDQLVIFSDFHLPKHHRLVEELVARRHDVVEQLRLPVSDEPIHVYLFDTPERFQAFMARQYPQFPHCRTHAVALYRVRLWVSEHYRMSRSSHHREKRWPHLAGLLQREMVSGRRDATSTGAPR